MKRVVDVVIVGAGIAGLATTVALKKVGVRALVMEKSKGLRSTGTALTLSPDDWLALDALGVSHKLIPPLHSFIQDNSPFRLSSKLGAIESQEHGSDASIPVVYLEDETKIKSEVLIGCDGVHSAVARWLGLADQPFHAGRSAVYQLYMDLNETFFIG
ncbi:zeaxanthin epoxidase [Salix suchowensis]|nr:zeaxanthin epoxidase [Salix suchowensis]